MCYLCSFLNIRSEHKLCSGMLTKAGRLHVVMRDLMGGTYFQAMKSHLTSNYSETIYLINDENSPQR